MITSANRYVLNELAAIVGKWAAKAIKPRALEHRDAVPQRTSNVCSLDKAILDGIRSLQSDDRPDLLDRIFAAYLDGSRRLMIDLASARQSGSLSKMRSVAHALKSSSGNIGATEFSRLAADVERACDGLDEDRAVQLAQRMEAMYKSVVDAVESGLGTKSA